MYDGSFGPLYLPCPPNVTACLRCAAEAACTRGSPQPRARAAASCAMRACRVGRGEAVGPPVLSLGEAAARRARRARGQTCCAYTRTRPAARALSGPSAPSARRHRDNKRRHTARHARRISTVPAHVSVGSYVAGVLSKASAPQAVYDVLSSSLRTANVGAGLAAALGANSGAGGRAPAAQADSPALSHAIRELMGLVTPGASGADIWCALRGARGEARTLRGCMHVRALCVALPTSAAQTCGRRPAHDAPPMALSLLRAAGPDAATT